MMHREDFPLPPCGGGSGWGVAPSLNLERGVVL
jgi:hypothetical protein